MASNISITREYKDRDATAYALIKILEKEGFVIKDTAGRHGHDCFEYLYSLKHKQIIPYRGQMQIQRKKESFKLDLQLENEYSPKITIIGPEQNKDGLISFLDAVARFDSGTETSLVALEEPFKEHKYYALSGLFNLFSNPDVRVLKKSSKDNKILTLQYSRQLEEFVPLNGLFEIIYKNTDYSILLEDGYIGEMKLSIQGPGSKLNEMKEIISEIKKSIPHSEETKVVSLGGDLVQLKNYSWTDIGGLEEQKQKLEELVSWPLKKPDLLREKGVKAPKAILFYGPPGTGKTLIAKVIACESGVNFIKADAADITSKWYGQEEKNIREMFAIARKHTPSIIFLDEIDAIARKRDERTHEATQRAVNQFLIELDGISELEGVTVIAATNRPDILDPAFLRPGRFNNKIEIAMPNMEARLKIYQIHSKNLSLADDVELEKLAEIENISGADIANICNEAGYGSIRKYLTKNQKTLMDVCREEYEHITVSHSDFEKAINEALVSKEIGNEKQIG